MSQAYGTPEERDERESIATIHRALERGCTFLDTAEVYGPYMNEELLGPRAQGARANLRAASAVRELAARKGMTPAQVALAWLLHKGPDSQSLRRSSRARS